MNISLILRCTVPKDYHCIKVTITSKWPMLIIDKNLYNINVIILIKYYVIKKIYIRSRICCNTGIVQTFFFGLYINSKYRYDNLSY